MSARLRDAFAVMGVRSSVPPTAQPAVSHAVTPHGRFWKWRVMMLMHAEHLEELAARMLAEHPASKAVAWGLGALAIVFMGAAGVTGYANFGTLADTFQRMGSHYAIACALSLVMAEAITGFFVVESWGWSRLLPFARDLGWGGRLLLILVAGVAFFSVVGLEVGLAYERASLLASARVTEGALQHPDEAVPALEIDWADVWTQGALGFVLPISTMLATLVIELFQESVRTICTGCPLPWVLRRADKLKRKARRWRMVEVALRPRTKTAASSA